MAFALKWLGFEPLVATAARNVFTGGKETLQQRTHFPGYVFFRTKVPNAAGISAIPGLDHHPVAQGHQNTERSG